MPQLFEKTIYLPSDLRDSLRRPLGICFFEKKDSRLTTLKVIDYISLKKVSLVIAVGDIISWELVQARYIPSLAVIDGQSRRQKLNLNILDKFREFGANIHFGYNSAGTISTHSAQLIAKLIRRYEKEHQSQVLYIKGEEDLLTLPAVYFGNYGAFVIYGQYDVGVVVVKIDKLVKRKIIDLVRRFAYYPPTDVIK